MIPISKLAYYAISHVSCLSLDSISVPLIKFTLIIIRYLDTYLGSTTWYTTSQGSEPSSHKDGQ